MGNNPIMFIDPDGMEVINGDENTSKIAQNNVMQKAMALGEAMVSKEFDRTTKKGESAYQKNLQTSLKEYNKASKDSQKAENRAKETQARIDDFKNVDPENFNRLDNMTYTDAGGKSHTLDVVVTSGNMRGNYDGGITSYSVDASGTIFSLGGNIHSVSVTIKAGSPISSNTLAHEGGHVVSLAANPIGYYNSRRKEGEINCQSLPTPANSVKAIEWQNRYDKLKK
jgi:hypothetical protein